MRLFGSASSAPREILVFVSSPADRHNERMAARDAIARANDRLSAGRHGRVLKAVMWEDLPPGDAPDGDFQALIDMLLEKFDRSSFGIYLGFVGACLGAPTPRYASGTVEEFEESLARHRRTGSPEQVLFYFIDPDASRSQSVSAFRADLEKRDYLYRSVAAKDFAAQAEEALFLLAAHWDDWAPWLRRTNRRAALPLTAVAALMLLALATWIVWVSLETRRLLATGPVEACNYLLERPLPLDPFGVIPELDARFSAAIGANLDRSDGAAVKQRIALYIAWSRCPTSNPALRPALEAPLRSAVDRTARAITLTQAGGLDVDLVRAGRDAGVFAKAPDLGLELAQLAASRRLFDRQILPGDNPFERLKRLSDAERRAVAAFAKAAWRSDAGTGDRRQALAAASGNVDIVAEALWAAADGFDQRRRLFVRSAAAMLPEDRLLSGMSRFAPLNGNSPKPALFFTEAVIEGLADRRPALFGLLKQLRTPFAPELEDVAVDFGMPLRSVTSGIDRPSARNLASVGSRSTPTRTCASIPSATRAVASCAAIHAGWHEA